MGIEKRDFNFQATGIGSVPSLDIEGTCGCILEKFPSIPFWPQFVKRTHLEDMLIQFTEGLPLLQINGSGRISAIPSSAGRESALVTFYEHFLNEDFSHFAISGDYAPGLYTLLEKVQKRGDSCGTFIKGHTVGPVTLAAGVSIGEGHSLFQDPDLLDAMVKGLAIKAMWQAKEMGQTGRRPILFVDEPYLSGFGSAFSLIQREQVIHLLQEVFGYLRERSDTLLGIHCCGNTDWSMILEAEPDIVSFDAYGFLDYFLLYPDDITRFLRNGGSIAWGIVPTGAFTGKESVEGLFTKLQEGLGRLHQWGLDPHEVVSHSLLTPACGLGTMEQSAAHRVLELLSQLSQKCREGLQSC